MERERERGKATNTLLISFYLNAHNTKAINSSVDRWLQSLGQMLQPIIDTIMSLTEQSTKLHVNCIKSIFTLCILNLLLMIIITSSNKLFFSSSLIAKSIRAPTDRLCQTFYVKSILKQMYSYQINIIIINIFYIQSFH